MDQKHGKTAVMNQSGLARPTNPGVMSSTKREMGDVRRYDEYDDFDRGSGRGISHIELFVRSSFWFCRCTVLIVYYYLY